MSGPSEFPWKKAAFVLIVCFLAGYALQVAVSMSGRGELEYVVQPSAVGDDSYFPLPDNLVEGMALAKYDGQTLVAAATEPEKARSVSMMRVGKEESGLHDVYQSSDEDEDGTLQGIYFLKTAPRHFLRVRIQEAPVE